MNTDGLSNRAHFVTDPIFKQVKFSLKTLNQKEERIEFSRKLSHIRKDRVTHLPYLTQEDFAVVATEILGSSKPVSQTRISHFENGSVSGSPSYTELAYCYFKHWRLGIDYVTHLQESASIKSRHSIDVEPKRLSIGFEVCAHTMTLISLALKSATDTSDQTSYVYVDKLGVPRVFDQSYRFDKVACPTKTAIDALSRGEIDVLVTSSDQRLEELSQSSPYVCKIASLMPNRPITIEIICAQKRLVDTESSLHEEKSLFGRSEYLEILISQALCTGSETPRIAVPTLSPSQNACDLLFDIFPEISNLDPIDWNSFDFSQGVPKNDALSLYKKAEGIVFVGWEPLLSCISDHILNETEAQRVSFPLEDIVPASLHTTAALYIFSTRSTFYKKRIEISRFLNKLDNEISRTEASIPSRVFQQGNLVKSVYRCLGINVEIGLRELKRSTKEINVNLTSLWLNT